MVCKYIRLGDLNRKHLIPFFLGLSNLVNQLIIKFYPEKDHRGNSVLDLYSSSVSFIFVLFIPCII